MEYTKELKDVNTLHVKNVGGKGLSLGVLTNAGFRVPGGYILLADALKDFLTYNDLNVILDEDIRSLDFNNSEKLATVSEATKKKIIFGKFPPKMIEEIFKRHTLIQTGLVAVRSSANVEDGLHYSWAGQFSSALGVTNENLLEAIKECWSSQFSVKALTYWHKNSLLEVKISMAIIIQELIIADKAGVSFSINPITKNNGEMALEACFGFGEGVVSGAITPDTYIIRKNDMKILNSYIGVQTKKMVVSQGSKQNNSFGKCIWQKMSVENGKQQILTEAEIVEIGNITKKIEEWSGHPVDVEWALNDKDLYIVQSRPITTL